LWRTICAPGDPPGAAGPGAHVRAALVEAGFTLRRFS
jgi:hypothetical protein